MKKIHYLTLLLSIAFTPNSFAQKHIIINTVHLDSIQNGEYISVDFFASFGKYKLKIEYGQKHNFFRNRVAKNEFWKTISFYSKSHAFNVLADRGWVYIDRYDFIVDPENEKQTYLFKKYN